MSDETPSAPSAPSAPPDASPSKLRAFLRHAVGPRGTLVLSILLAAVLAFAGGAKILEKDFEIEAFRAFGLPEWLMIQVGWIEVVAAALLLAPATTSFGGIIGVGVMIVAMRAHLVHGQPVEAAVAGIFLLLLVRVGWARRERFARMIAQL